MTDLHGAAERWLTRVLSYSMGSVPSVAIAPGVVFMSGVHEGHDEPEEQPMGLGGIRALEAVGAISAEEGAAWRRRFELARGGRAPAVDSDAAARARAHLHALAEGDDPGRLERVGAALGLFLQAGLLDSESLAEQLDTLAPALGLEHDGDEGEEDAWEPHEPGEPLAVLAAPLARHGELALTCVEVRERGLVVHWHLLAESGESHDDPELEASDDAGTDYGDSLGGAAGWSGGSGPRGVIGRSEFEAAPPAHARTLTISGAAGAWRIPLPARR